MAERPRRSRAGLAVDDRQQVVERRVRGPVQEPRQLAWVSRGAVKSLSADLNQNVHKNSYNRMCLRVRSDYDRQ